MENIRNEKSIVKWNRVECIKCIGWSLIIDQFDTVCVHIHALHQIGRNWSMWLFMAAYVASTLIPRISEPALKKRQYY